MHVQLQAGYALSLTPASITLLQSMVVCRPTMSSPLGSSTPTPVGSDSILGTPSCFPNGYKSCGQQRMEPASLQPRLLQDI